MVVEVPGSVRFGGRHPDVVARGCDPAVSVALSDLRRGDPLAAARAAVRRALPRPWDGLGADGSLVALDRFLLGGEGDCRPRAALLALALGRVGVDATVVRLPSADGDHWAVLALGRLWDDGGAVGWDGQVQAAKSASCPRRAAGGLRVALNGRARSLTSASMVSSPSRSSVIVPLRAVERATK